MTSPYAFYQFWVNADDRDVGTYLKVFSFRSREEIEALEKAVAERPAAREAQRALAEELTALVHGEAQRDAVVAASQALFGRGSLEDLDEADPGRGAGGAAAGRGARSGRRRSLPPLVELLADSGLCASRSAARRAIAEGGAYVNNTRIADEGAGAGGGRPARRPVAGAAARQAPPRGRRGRSVALGSAI